MPLFPAPATYVQENLYMRILRLVQLAFSVVVLGIAAANVASWRDGGCDSPPKLNFVLATALISFIILIYLILSTGKPRITFLPWHHFVQFGLDVFLLIFWIAATGVSNLSCSDACKACKSAALTYDSGCGWDMAYGNSYCSCYLTSDVDCDDDYYYYANRHKRALFDAAKVFEKRARGTGNRKVNNGARIGINAVMLVLMLASIVGTAYLFWQSRKTSQSSNTSVPTAPAVADQSKEGPPMQQQAGGMPIELSQSEHPVSPLTHDQGHAAGYYGQGPTYR